MKTKINATKIDFDGLKALEIVTQSIRLVLVYEIGPRIAFFGKTNSENLLYWKKDAISRKNWKLYGGHRVWLTRPYADESEDTYFEDNAPCKVEISDFFVEVTALAYPINQIERGMKIEIISDTQVKVTNFLVNAGDLIYSGSVWSPTCVEAQNRKIIVPLGDENATWDVVKMAIPLKFAGNKTQIENEQITFCGNDIVLTPKDKCVKRVLQAKKGIVKLLCEGFEFIKYSKYNSPKFEF